MSIIALLILLLMFITPAISVMVIMLRFSERKQAANWPQVMGEVANVRLFESGIVFLLSVGIHHQPPEFSWQ